MQVQLEDGVAVATMEIDAELSRAPWRSRAAARFLASRRGPLPLVARHHGENIPQVLICLVHCLIVSTVSLLTLAVYHSNAPAGFT